MRPKIRYTRRRKVNAYRLQIITADGRKKHVGRFNSRAEAMAVFEKIRKHTAHK